MVSSINTATLFQSIQHRPTSLVKRGIGTASSGSDEGIVEISQENPSQNLIKALKTEFGEQMENSRESAEAKAEFTRKMQLLFEIASRIMRGDNVPQSDKNFLGEHSPGLFMLAMSSRNLDNENPRNHEALARESNNQIPSKSISVDSNAFITSRQPQKETRLDIQA